MKNINFIQGTILYFCILLLCLTGNANADDGISDVFGKTLNAFEKATSSNSPSKNSKDKNRKSKNSIPTSSSSSASPVSAVDFSWEPQKVDIMTEIQFKNSSKDESLKDEWEWDFGDGTNSTEKEPKHIFNKPGTYKVTLYGATKYDYSYQETKTITVLYPEPEQKHPAKQAIVFPKYSEEAETNNTIQPFGEILWRDSLLDVVRKLNNIEGIERLCVSFMRDVVRNTGDVSVKGVVDRKGLEEKLGECMFVANEDSLDVFKKDSRYVFYIDKHKNEIKCLKWYEAILKVTAFPIVISGLPFRLEVRFVLEPGIAIEKPENVFKETQFNSSFPLLIDRVVLWSDSSMVVSQWEKIAGLLHKKYGLFIKQTSHQGEYKRFYPSRWKGVLCFQAVDIFGNGIYAEVDKANRTFPSTADKCTIIYKKNIDYFKQELASLYSEHEIKVEQEKYAHLPESVSDVISVGRGANVSKWILPYGDLLWNDGLFDIITKLKNKEGVNKIEIVKVENSGRLVFVCDVYSVASKEELANILTHSIKDGLVRIHYDVSVQTFINANGEKSEYVGAGDDTDVGLRLRASSVSVLGVPCSIVVLFRSLPGYMLVYPEKVLHSNSGWVYPFTISKVLLMEDESVLSFSGNHVEYIVDKYRKSGAVEMDAESAKRRGLKGIFYRFQPRYDEFFAEDAFGSSVRVKCRKSRGDSVVCYERAESSFSVFSEKYEEHTRQIETAKINNKPKMDESL